MINDKDFWIRYLLESTVNIATKLVGTALWLDYQRTSNPFCNKSVSELAKETGLSTRSITRAVNELYKYKWIRKRQQENIYGGTLPNVLEIVEVEQ